MTSIKSFESHDFEYYRNLYANQTNNNTKWSLLVKEVEKLTDNDQIEVALQVATELFSKSQDSYYKTSHRTNQDLAFRAIVCKLTEQGEIKRAIDVAQRALDKTEQYEAIVEGLVKKGLISEALMLVKDPNVREFDEMSMNRLLFIIADEMVQVKTIEKAVAVAFDMMTEGNLRTNILKRAAGYYIKENNVKAVRALIENKNLSEYEINWFLVVIAPELSAQGYYDDAVEMKEKIKDEEIRIKVNISPPAPPPPFPKLS